ncbi:unnamed protein product [Rotaria sordida]|uniref:Concanavalin A-like lectin/glucanase domain-containing protein n=1 Tax=Rotaria sordida TaxID=392033 RepID=A0A814H9W4_9BILA|nr:unnamed protein product [Rotaria sordida]
MFKELAIITSYKAQFRRLNFRYIYKDNPIVSCWRSWIMNDEYLLNQWFSRLLKRSRTSYSAFTICYFKYWEHQRISDIDRLLFPINLQSSKCWFLPWGVSRYASGYQHLFERFYSSFCDSSHSFSFWLFLSRQHKLNIQIGNKNDHGLSILLCGNEKYQVDNGKSVSIADRWVHFVLTKIDSQSNYQIWIDGQCVSNINQYRTTPSDIDYYFVLTYILLMNNFDDNPLEASSQARIADLNAYKRCLTLVEIRAIHQQQTSIEQVKVGTYINNNKMHNMQVNYR